jgi:hypothetical protein
MIRRQEDARAARLYPTADPSKLLIDPRLPDQRIEVYFDEPGWRERQAEQRAWDATHSALREPPAPTGIAGNTDATERTV